MLKSENPAEISIEELERRMRPRGYSTAGFLGKAESLEARLESDRRLLEKLGLTYEQFADRLEVISQKAIRLINLVFRNDPNADYCDVIDAGVLVERKFLVTWVSWKGYQECPWECQGREALSDTNYTIKNMATGRTIRFSELLPHLIRNHHFFEGDTSYRLDPQMCADVLEMVSGVDYTPQYQSKEYWCHGSGSWTYKTPKMTAEEWINRSCGDMNFQFVRDGVEIPISLPGMKGYKLRDELLVINPEEDWYGDFEVDGIPFAKIATGAYKYNRRVLKWIDD